MRRNRVLPLLITGAALALAVTPAWGAGAGITFTLNGKAVTAVPVDQLGALTVTVNGGKPFKSIFAGQWGGIGQALTLRGKAFDKTASAPDVSGSQKWSSAELAATALDSGWSTKSTAGRSMFEVAQSMRLYDASTNQNLAFTARFMRLSYTGKTFWQNGGWVKETVWETLGTPVGQAVLRLEPPRSAGALTTGDVFAKAAADQYKAKMAAESLLSPTGSQGDFDASRILKVEPRPGVPIAYNWNYEGDDQFVYARVPVNVTLHASSTNIPGMLPGTIVVADFVCPMFVSAKQRIGAPWQFHELEVSSTLRADSRTTDGRTADQVSASADPAAAMQGDPNKSTQEKALDLLKGFGL